MDKDQLLYYFLWFIMNILLVIFNINYITISDEEK